jgi:predicted GNAT family N-acyltransferase
MTLDLKVVSTPDELQQAFAVRALVYIGEQNCPWLEEFDGNDFSATQVLGTIDGEPVATARVRWFAGFAKLERLAIRAEHRGLGHGHALLRFLLDLCRKKGFSRLYLHAQARLERFYAGYGFARVGQPFVFSDYGYLEMVAELDDAGSILTLDDGPFVLNRPEGRWSEPGVLDFSISRAADQTVAA